MTTQVAEVEQFKPYQPQENEEYMSKQMRQHFRSMLHAWKRQIMEGVDHTITNMKNARERYADDADTAAQEEEFRLELRERDRERKLLKNIERSIDMIDQDDYGYCDDCGAEIGVRRLEARPTATKCIDCKTLSEIRERHIGR